MARFGVELGAAVGAAFGGAWFAYAALLVFPQYGVLDVIVAVVLALAVIGFARRPAEDRSKVPDALTSAEAPRGRRTFFIVLITELVLINVAWSLLRGAHHPEYLVAAIAVIVGLHFIPLASIFRDRIFYVPAVIMTGAGALAGFTLWSAVACIACAAALWTAVCIRPARKSA